MSLPDEDDFSVRWTFASMAIFVGLEIVLGGLVGTYVADRYQSLPLGFLVQVVLNLSSYFVGGVLIGALSPGVRTVEPAVGAFLSVALMLSLTLFTPFTFLQFSLTKLLIGGGIAFALSLLGARLGERLTGNKV